MKKINVDNNKLNDALVALGGFSAQGGMYEYLEWWALRLDSEGHNVGIVGNKGLISSQLERFPFVELDTGISKSGYKWFIIDYIFNLFKHARVVKNISSLLGNKPSRIRILDDFSYSSLFIVLFLMYYRHQIIVTIHDPIRHSHSSKKWFTEFVVKINRSLIFITSWFGLITLHFHDKRLIEKTVWSRLKSVIIEPIPIPKPKYFFPVINKPDDQLKLVFCGRIEGYKGVERLISCYKDIAKECDDFKFNVRLTIAGRKSFDGPNIEEDLNFESLHIINSFIQEKCLHKLINEADYVVLPYLTATASGIAVLAASYQTKIICSDVGVLPSIAKTVPDSIIMKHNTYDELKNVMYSAHNSWRLTKNV